ncbi:unnamed protein product, partial [Brassica rapa]
QPTWAKITRTVHGKGQRADPRGPKSPEQSTGRVSVLSPRTNVLICVQMDSHRRPVCADGHTQTATDVLCWKPTDILCVLNRQPTWAKITRTVHGKGQHAESKDQRAVIQTVHGKGQRAESKDEHAGIQPTWAKITRTVHGKGQHAESKDQRADMCTDGQPRPQPTWAKITRTVHGKGQRAESKDQRADMCTDGQPRPSCVCWRTPTDVLCVLNRHPTWPKITRTVHGKGQRAESKDQRADMCTDGQPRTSSTDVLCVLTDTHGHTRT